MASTPNLSTGAQRLLDAKRVYVMAAICLVAGLGIGYLLPGSSPPASPLAGSSPSATAAAPMRDPHAITMADMKGMADAQAAPLLAKLKSDPNNVTLLCEVGATYHVAHQFHDAAAYYGKAEELEPGNVAIRTKLASSLFRDGDADGAIAQLNEALKSEPGNANALYDLGIIRLQGKGDGRGAVAAWQQLLKANPQLSADRRAAVAKLMADVTASLNEQSSAKGARSDGKRKSDVE
ncbi:MAG TPA: tetratricopeptide repeat protein [Acidobacteriaceae bacterium]